MTNQKFNDKSYGMPNNSRNILIVGQNPGKQRRGKQTGIVWEGNRSGDFLSELVASVTLHNNDRKFTNATIVLTNVCNYQDITADHLTEGLRDLANRIIQLQPDKIICLGLYAYKHVMTMQPTTKVQVFHHPSFVLRFNKNVDLYASKLRKELIV